jgi:hypothetical protein
MRKAWRFSCRETGELPVMMMISASKKDEWGAPTRTGASALVACRPLIVIRNPEKFKHRNYYNFTVKGLRICLKSGPNVIKLFTSVNNEYS